MASSPDRHRQTSPEGSDVSMGMPLTEDQRISASNRLYQIVGHFEHLKNSGRTYDQPRLIRLTYEYSRSEESRDLFIRTFFHFMAFPLDNEEEPVYEELESGFNDFADHLMNNLFLPRKDIRLCLHAFLILTLYSESIRSSDATTFTGISFLCPRSDRGRADFNGNTRFAANSPRRMSNP